MLTSAASAGRPARTCWGLQRALLMLAIVGAVSAVGCAPGVSWRRFSYDEGYQLAQKEARPIFVYFRAWWLVECTQFEDTVLKDPAVVNQTSDMVCVMLNYGYEPDKKLAESWGISRSPAFAVVSPTGELLGKGEGMLTPDSVALMLRGAKEKYVMRRPPAAAPKPPGR